MVKVRLAGILKTSYKQKNQSKLADKSLILLNLAFISTEEAFWTRILVTYLLICLQN